MAPWSQLAPKVHLRRKVTYRKCNFLNALHFTEMWALDLRFVDPVGSISDLWFCIKTYTKINKIKETKWISIKIMQTWFTFQRCLESLRKTPWSQLAPKVHLRRKVKYWKCRFLSALHFPEIEGSRFRTKSSRIQRLSLKSVIFLEGKGWEEKAWRWRRSQRLTSLILKTLHLP